MTDQSDPTHEVLETWDGVAPAWERHRERLFVTLRPVSEWLVTAIDPQTGQVVLELAAGPGETGFLAAERVGSSGRVISTDLAPRMVDAARRGAEGRGFDNVEFRVMDAQQMDLPDGSVDAVMCRFGFMLMPDPGRALSETRRVLRPGGPLSFAVWAPPDRNPWVSLLGASLMQLGLAPPSDPFGPGGMFSLSAPETARDVTLGAGFSSARAEEIPLSQSFDSFDDYWGFLSEIAGSFAILLRSLPPGEVDRIRRTLEELSAPFRTEKALQFPALALGVAAS